MPPESSITLAETDAGRQVELRVGDAMVVRLPENPTTGYRWSVDMDAVSARGIALENSQYAIPPGTGVGGSGQRTFVFRAVQIGTAELRLKLWQPWGGDSSIIERFSVAVHVMA